MSNSLQGSIAVNISSLDQIQHLSSLTFNVVIQSFVAYKAGEATKDNENEEEKQEIVFADNYITRVPLYNKSESCLTEPARDVLSAIFKQFATNDDGSMSMKDLQRYIFTCGAGMNSATDTRIQALFDAHGTEKKAIQDRWSLTSFLNFYMQACEDRPVHVWNDIKTFKYQNDLTQKEYKEKLMKPIILNESMCESDNTDTIRWQLSDDEIANIKSAKAGDIMKSPVFIMHKFKFQLWLYVCVYIYILVQCMI